MDNNLFDHIVLSIKEAGAIKRDEIQASRITDLNLPDSKGVPKKMELTPTEFSEIFM
jgi:putative transcriptional regulator